MAVQVVNANGNDSLTANCLNAAGTTIETVQSNSVTFASYEPTTASGIAIALTPTTNGATGASMVITYSNLEH